MALVRCWAELVAEHRRGRRCRGLLVDETSMRRRHRYVRVIVNGDTGKTLAMVPHRSAAALSGFFIAQGRSWCRGVKVVVSDGSKSYRSAIDAHVGDARHVLDRFHVIRWFSAGLTAVRRDVQRRQPQAPNPPLSPRFPARFALAAPRRYPHRSGPGPPQGPLRRPPPAQIGPAGPTGTPRPQYPSSLSSRSA